MTPALLTVALALAAPQIDAADARLLTAACEADGCDATPDAVGEAVFVVLVDTWLRYGIADGAGAANLRALSAPLFDALPDAVRAHAGDEPAGWVVDLLAPAPEPEPAPEPKPAAPTAEPEPAQKTARLQVITGGAAARAPLVAPDPPDTKGDLDRLDVVRRPHPEHPNTGRAYKVICRSWLDVDNRGAVTAVEVDPSGCPASYAESTETALSAWRFAPKDPSDDGPWRVGIQTSYMQGRGGEVTLDEALAAWNELAVYYDVVPSNGKRCEVGVEIAEDGAIVGLTTSDPERCLALAQGGGEWVALPEGARSCTASFTTNLGRPLYAATVAGCSGAAKGAVRRMVDAWMWLDLELGTEKYDVTFTFR